METNKLTLQVKEKQSASWYMALRGELLAEQFLVDLNIGTVTKSPPGPLDFMLMLSEKHGPLKVVGVEVKATEQEINGQFALQPSTVRRLQGSNIPVLVLVVDVKRSEIYFNWIPRPVPSDAREQPHSRLKRTLELRKDTPEERKRLKSELLDL